MIHSNKQTVEDIAGDEIAMGEAYPNRHVLVDWRKTLCSKNRGWARDNFVAAARSVGYEYIEWHERQYKLTVDGIANIGIIMNMKG